jgi:hypothetical protein
MCSHYDDVTIGEKSPKGFKTPPVLMQSALDFLRKIQKVCGPAADVRVFGGFPLMWFGGGDTTDLDLSVPTGIWSLVCESLVEFAGAVQKTPNYSKYSRMFDGRIVRIATLTLPLHMGGFDVDILDSKPVGGLDFRVNGIVWNTGRNSIVPRQGIEFAAILRDISTKTTVCTKRFNILASGGVHERIDACNFLKRVVRMVEKGWKLKDVPDLCSASRCDDCSICGGVDSSSGRMAAFHVKLQCGVEGGERHHFCVECLTKWMCEIGPGNSKCPLCRKDILFKECPLLIPSDLDIVTTVPKGKSVHAAAGAACSGAACSGDGSGDGSGASE